MTTMMEGVSAEERQLQLDFHAMLADYVVGRRQVERHPDAEQRCVVGIDGQCTPSNSTLLATQGDQ